MSAGFTDPTRQTQLAFRAILDALARPTIPFTLTGPTLPPTPLSSAVAAIALTLCDEDTPVLLDATLAAGGAVAGWFAFHTGAPVSTDPARAAFVFATGFDQLPSLAGLAAGTDEQPHRSATVVIDVTGTGHGDETLRATGPGIDGRTELTVPRGFAEVWQRNTARFPMGVDLLLVDGDEIRGLPRTTQLRAPEGVA